MEKTFIQRRVFKGGEVKRGYRVTGITCVGGRAGDRPVELAQVQNMDDYSSGCKLHRGGCFGHMCVTPTGDILPPHSLSFRSGDIRTQYYIACARAFDQDSPGYIEELKKTNYGKEGHLRSIMSTPVSGSARLVAIPHDAEDPYVVYISENLASKVVFCLPERDSEGREGSVYTERSLVEGDYVMLERPPSLTKFNNQPFLLAFWDKECVGVHPAVFGSFHGDYDGDEVHLYALGTVEAIDEARAWTPPTDPKFGLARGIMRENFPREYTGTGSEGDLKFLEYTTLSFNQVMEGNVRLATGDLTRNKGDHIRMFRDRLREKPGTKTFLQEAREGVSSIMRQQLSQGVIGDMSRVARISLMCFVRGEEGGTYVVTRRTRVLLDRESTPSSGSPAVRCSMLLCQVAQQAALDAHRVGSRAPTSIDLVSSVLKGRLETGEDRPCKTLYVLSGCTLEEARRALRATWVCATEGRVVAVALDSAAGPGWERHVVGSYSPVVLSACPGESRREICSLALNVVFNYYGLEVEGDDMRDLVTAMCYRTELSTFPITTREGMLARGLGWMETLMACDYTKIQHLKGSSSLAWSATSAVMCSNFNLLP